MTFDELKAEAKKLITQNRVEDSLKLIASNLKEDQTDDIILLQRRFAEMKEKSLRDLIPVHQWNTEMNAFSANLLSTINVLVAAQFKDDSLMVDSVEMNNNSLIDRLLEATKEIGNLKAQLAQSTVIATSQSFTVTIILQCDQELADTIDDFKCVCKIYDDDRESTLEVPIRNKPGGPTITLNNIQPSHFIEVHLLKKDDTIKLKSHSFSAEWTRLNFQIPNG